MQFWRFIGIQIGYFMQSGRPQGSHPTEIFLKITPPPVSDRFFCQLNAFARCAEAFPSRAEAFPLHAESFSLHAEAFPSHAEAFPSHEEAFSSHEEAFSSHAKAFFSHAEAFSSHAKASKGIQISKKHLKKRIFLGKNAEYTGGGSFLGE